ncbi:MAG: hypothetical protein ACFFBD_27530 [Candidatus Hodarchaeota archaeon]
MSIIKELHEEITLPWIKLTPAEISNTKTMQLKHYGSILQRSPISFKNLFFYRFKSLLLPELYLEFNEQLEPIKNNLAYKRAMKEFTEK